MQHHEFQPPEAMQNSIKCFWHNVRRVEEAQTVFEVTPDGYAEIIFYFGSLFSDAYQEGLEPLPSPFMMGLLNKPVIFHTKSHLEVIGIRCFPWTVFDLLGLPSDKKGVSIVKHPIARLHNTLRRLIEAGKVEDVINELTHYFLTAQSPDVNDSTLIKAGVAMSKAKGTLPVSAVAAAAHATVRTLERKFKQSSGFTVKDVSALMRFEQVRNQLWHFPDSGLAGLAHEVGYTDQSHLSREFKRFSGITPGSFARNAKKRKQAAGDDFVAFIQV